MPNPRAKALMAGAAVWGVSEIAQMAGDGLSAVSLWLTLLAFMLLSVGAPALHGGQTPPAGALSRICAGAMALGFGCFAVVTVALLTGSAESDAQIMAEGGVIGALFVLGIGSLILGSAGFAWSAYRAGVYPIAGPMLLVLALAGYLITGVAELGGVAGNLVNITMAMALLVLGRTVLDRSG